MISKMSKREKTLVLATAALLLILAAGQFAIRPLYTAYSDAQARRESLLLQQDAIEAKLLSEDATRAARAAAREAFLEVGGRYPTAIPNEDVDRLLSYTSQAAGLNPSSLSMSGASNFTAPEVGAGSSSGTDGADSAAFKRVSANMTFQGNYGSLLRLIDAVAETDSIRISRFSFSGDSGSANISVSFEVLMLNEAPPGIDGI